ncbi:hypothetical protein C365_03613 [Cryptococcus neoformans Bt85]|nr:hypothetical protein C365_03613 [Cryptococcus neoformans var. grubii Bt85]
MLNSGASTTELEAMHDDFDLYCDLYNGSKQVAADVMWVVKDVWWWSDIIRLGAWVLYESWQHDLASQGRRSTPIFRLPITFMDADLGFRRCNDSNLYRDLQDCINRPEIDCTRGMVNYRLVEKRNPRALSPEADRAADPISDWETDQLPTLKEILQNGRKIGPAVKKHFQSLPVLDEDRSCALWASRADGDILSYRLELTEVIKSCPCPNSLENLIDTAASSDEPSEGVEDEIENGCEIGR